jgi:DUF1680 family protein
LPPFSRRDALGFIGLLAGSACGRREDSSYEAPPRKRTADLLSPVPLDRVRLGGYLGEKIDLCIRNRILAQDPEKLVKPFLERRERSCWQGEFWGKWFLSAAAAVQYTQPAGALERLHASVQALLRTQSADGYIGNYAPDSHLKSWDIWDRKYTLLGLLAWFDMTGDRAALEGARRLAMHLMTEVGPGKADIVRTGLYRGMASSSVLQPIVQLYRVTGDEQYLNFAAYIVSRWSSRQGPQLIEKALEGVPVAERFPRPKKWFSWENGGKAYEMMSCYAGLLELYRETSQPVYREACLKAYQNILETEINIAGSGSAEECWYGGHALQTRQARNTMETCVAVSWTQLCAQLLRITGDPRFADQIETTAYNALLGAMTPDGAAFAMYSPLEGVRELGPAQCGIEMNCCMANGPRGMLLLPQVAVMLGAEGPVVNLYSEGVWNLEQCRLEVRTGYPFTELVDIRIEPRRAEVFPLRLRIPAWSASTPVSVNGSPVAGVRAGAYASIERRWKPGDRVRLHLDLRGRMVRASDESRQYSAVMRGPVVLASDHRLGQNGMITGSSGTAALKVVSPPPGVRLAFAAGNGIRLCDYASAGNSWDSGSRYRVWMPLSG